MDVRRVAGWTLVALGAVSLALLLGASLLSFGSGARFGGLDALGLLFTLVVGGVVPLALVLVGWRLARPRGKIDEPPRARPLPVPAVGDADLASVPEPVSACPDCGYLGIRMPGIGDGLWPGGGELGDRMVCPRCQWQGLPVRFDTRTEYAAFLRELSA